MQKFLKILEKNVEWVALALGAAFLIWMVYGYLFQKPVVSIVAGTPLTPGQIDQKIVDGPVMRLRAAMSSTAVPPMPIQDFLTDLTRQLTAPPQAVALNGPWSGIPLPPQGELQPQQPLVPQAIQVTALPTPAPAPVNLQFSQGRSNVLIPTPAAASAAPVNDQQGTPADKNWVTVSATIPMKQLAALFVDKKIPADFLTTLLRVDLVRQEEDASGNWGPETTVAPLTNVDLQPLPNQNAGIGPQNDYISWAEKNQISLLQPPFYKVLQADPWFMPGQQPPTPPPVAEEVPDPAKVAEQQKEAEAEARKKAAQDAARARQAQPQRPPRPPGPGGPPLFDIIVSNQPMELAQAGPPGGMIPPPGGVQPYYGGPGGGPPPAPVNPADAANAIGQVPAGSFDPHVQPDVTIWAHDDSVQPGHTYRYKLRYTLANPVRLSTNVCTPQALANVFAILSSDSEWSVPISVKSDTNFFAVNTAPGREEVKFEIFRWQNGAWQSETVEADPGDMIGTPRGAGDARIDFTTGLTLVAVRNDPRNSENRIIILTSDNGQLERHDLNADRNSAEYKRLKDQVNAKTAAAPAGPQATAGP